MRHASYAMTGVAVVALFLFAGQTRADDEPEIAVEADATEIFIGESVDYLVEIRNVKSPSPPDLTALRPDFDVVPTGNESRNQSSTFIMNGRVTQQNSFGHVYRFRLTPKRTGSLVIAAPSVMVDGKTVSGRSLALSVTAPEVQDLVIALMKSDREKVYPTQPFEVTLRVLVRPLPNGADRDPLTPLRRQPPHIEVNWVDVPAGLSGDDKARWLEKLLSEDGSGFALNDVTMRSGAFAFFDGPRAAVFNLYQGRESRKGLDGSPVNYFVYELKRKFTGEKTGTYTLGPAVVKGSFVGGVRGNNYTARRLVAVSSAVSVEVAEVPAPRPATFCGGIGDYRVKASASPTNLRVGDPLTLTLDFERGQTSGSLDLISAPELAATRQLAEDFEIVDENPTGRKEGEMKRFEYALRPKRAGVGIPSLAVTVFNPDTERFTEIATQSIALTVSAAGRLDAGDLVGSVAGSGPQEIKSRAQGIFQNVTDPSQLNDERVNIVALAEVAAGLWCGVGCLIAVVTAHRRKSGDLAWQRKRRARRTAAVKLTEAGNVLAQGQSMDAMRAIRSALVGLIADMRNIVADGLTASEVDATLAGTSVSADDRAEALRLLEAIERAEYGSGITSDVRAMIETAKGLIPRLARHLERGS